MKIDMWIKLLPTENENPGIRCAELRFLAATYKQN
jgi:hypothetical protein